jgi:putative transcriptional regulator
MICGVIKLPIHLKIKEIINKRGITQKELSRLTGLHESTLSEIIRDSRTVINKNHLELIMKVLEINDFNEIFVHK